jgi:glutamate-1-semialdehyde 2,1-aminomutase
MSITAQPTPAAAGDAKTQDDYYAIAARVLPGLGLGGQILPEGARFIIDRGEGAWVRSVEGRWYLDYVGGAGANILGHCHPAVVEAVREQAGHGLHFYGTFNDLAIELAVKLADAIPCAGKIAFATTGSEATFYAMRMARAFTKRTKILKFEGGYHGNHDYSAFGAFASEPVNYPLAGVDTGGVPPVLQETVLVAPYNNLEAVTRIVEAHVDDLAAIIVEPLQRIIFADVEFLRGLRKLCDETGVLLIYDEVVTGFRLAWGGGQEHYGVIPDLAAYGKIIGGGGPLSCVAGRADIIDSADPAHRGQPDYAFTNGTLHGNPMASAAGIAMLDVLAAPGFYADLHAKADRLTRELQSVIDRHGIPALVAGQASFWQFLFMGRPPTTQADIMRSDLAAMRKLDTELLKRGVYVLPGIRRFVSAVNTDEDFARTAEILDDICRAL